MNWYEKGLIELDNLVKALQKELPDKYKYSTKDLQTIRYCKFSSKKEQSHVDNWYTTIIQ
jgi:hypothetical protein